MWNLNAWWGARSSQDFVLVSEIVHGQHRFPWIDLCSVYIQWVLEYLCRVPVFLFFIKFVISSTAASPTLKELRNLAREVLEFWFDLGLELVPKEKVIQIRDDNKAWQTLYDKANKMLETWRDMGCSSTYKELGDALRCCGKGILAEKYCSMDGWMCKFIQLSILFLQKEDLFEVFSFGRYWSDLFQQLNFVHFYQFDCCWIFTIQIRVKVSEYIRDMASVKSRLRAFDSSKLHNPCIVL